MSYPPIMVRQWPFDGYSRQPVGTPSASRGIQAQFRPGYAGLVGNSSLSQGTAIQASAYRAALASANEEQPRAEEAAGHSQCRIKAKREPVEISPSRGRRRRVAHGRPTPSSKRNTAQRAKPSWRIQTVRIAPIRLRTTIAARKMPFSRQTLTAIA